MKSISLTIFALVLSNNLWAGPPTPLESSKEELTAILEAMPSLDDGVVSISTQLDETYRVHVERESLLCAIDFVVTRVPAPGGPDGAYTIEV